MATPAPTAPAKPPPPLSLKRGALLFSNLGQTLRLAWDLDGWLTSRG